MGPQLIDKIVEGIRKIPKDLEYSLGTSPDLRNSDLLNRPYIALAGYVFAHRPQFVPDKFLHGARHWHDLADELHHTSHQSIDDYVRVNPGVQNMIKVLIALEIGRYSYEANSLRTNTLRLSSGLTANSKASWYGKLTSRLLRNCSNAQDCISKNNLSIITFNYDRSLELYLERELPRGELFRGLNSKDVVSPIHVHGLLEVSLPKSGLPLSTAYGESLIRSAENFRMMDDPRDPDDPALAARRLLDEAKRIYVFGFDFHPQNVELLDLGSVKLTKKMTVLNYTGSRSFEKRITDLGVNSNDIWKKPTGKFEISEAIDEGIFEV